MIDCKKAVVQWMEFKTPPLKPRRLRVDPDTDFITTLTGPRRAGKTFYCFQLIGELLERGAPKQNILYLNFEDDKLLGAEAKDLEGLVEAHRELYSPLKTHKTFLFLDEIQNVKDWDAWTRRIHDTEPNTRLILTGSSSKLLSREVSTRLRGRVLNHEVFPLSFQEFLAWKGFSYDAKTIAYSKQRTGMKRHFNEFLSNGGYPTTLAQALPRQTILQTYYESVIFKDVVERHGVKEVKKLRQLAHLLFESTAKEITYNKLTNKLKSIGFNISTNTVIEYLSYFEDAYLFFQNLKYDYSTTKQLGAIKKVYCIDNGLLNAVSFKFSEDLGRLLENAAYLELKRRRKNVYYHRDKHECDFLVQEKNRVTQAIQVTHAFTEENQERETGGLLEALKKYGLEEGTILTLDQDDTKTIDGKRLTITPAWKWFLEKE